MSDQFLARIDKARVYLEEAKTLSEVRHVMAIADAAIVYARRFKTSIETVNQAGEIRIRAERRLGEMLLETEMNAGGRPPKTGPCDGPVFTLSKTGITKNLSSRSQLLARTAIDDFEAAIATMKKTELQPLVLIHSLLREARFAEARAQVEEQARQKQLSATIAHSEYRPWVFGQHEDCDLLLTDPPYSTDVENIAEFAEEWLPVALDLVKPTGRAYVCIGAYPHELAAYLNVAPRDHIKLVQVLVWTYKNTLGPAPKFDYKQNWQAILYFRGLSAAALNCPLMNEQFSVMEINAPDGRIGDRYHEWQKPDELAEQLIRHSTNPGDRVVDPFAGTGTFLLSAAKLGRVAFGCDADRAQVDLAIQRGCHEG